MVLFICPLYNMEILYLPQIRDKSGSWHFQKRFHIYIHIYINILPPQNAGITVYDGKVFGAEDK